MKFIRFDSTGLQVNLDQVTHFIDRDSSIEVYSQEKLLIVITDREAQQFRAEIEKHNFR